MYMLFTCEYKPKALESKRDLGVASVSTITILGRSIYVCIFLMQFQSIAYLDHHISSVASYISGQQLFVVGGAVRDILLGVNAEPHDIDMTLAMQPDEVYESLQKADRDSFSLFRTEKF